MTLIIEVEFKSVWPKVCNARLPVHQCTGKWRPCIKYVSNSHKSISLGPTFENVAEYFGIGVISVHYHRFGLVDILV